MILNEIERAVICGKQAYRTNADFIDAIEAAVLSKLSQGVSVEPKFSYEKATDGVQGTHFYEVINPKIVPIWAALFTADQLQTAIAAARVKALEDAAVCMEEQDTQAPKYNAKAIRALKGGAA